MPDESDDALFEADDWFVQMLGDTALDLRRRAVSKLLAGNDTQCFSEEQYMQVYKELTDKVFNCTIDTPTLFTHQGVVMHLESTKMVRQVKPGIWVAVGGV